MSFARFFSWLLPVLACLAACQSGPKAPVVLVPTPEEAAYIDKPLTWAFSSDFCRPPMLEVRLAPSKMAEGVYRRDDIGGEAVGVFDDSYDAGTARWIALKLKDGSSAYVKADDFLQHAGASRPQCAREAAPVKKN